VEPVEIDTARLAPPQEPLASAAIAPAWHTLVLLAGIVALSIHGVSRFSAAHEPMNRLYTYGFTAILDLGMLAWVVFGLYLKRIPLSSLLGVFSFNFRSVAMDLGIAAVFWFGSLMVLGSLSLTWSGVETALTHRTSPPHAASKAERVPAPNPARLKSLHALAELAPANRIEIAAWVLLCLLVGFVEEVVFRGYLQRQFIGLARNGITMGVLASAIVFGGAHAYQGVRGMALLTVFGILFGVLALYRRSLRAGIFAHSWHDLIAGLTLALLRSNHII